MDKKEILEKLIQSNLLSLAFMGDAVHTQFVREYILSKANCKMSNFHTLATKFCKASAQAKTLQQLIPLLKEDELDIVRRARNAKPKHQAKNASTKDYNQATAFEALIGYLYFSEKNERLQEILKISIQPKE